MICNNCGSRSENEARFCSQCGAELVRNAGRYCVSCGTSNDPDAIYCSNCGAQITGKAQKVEQGSLHETSRQQRPRRNKGKYVPRNHTRSYFIAALVAVGLIVFFVIISRQSNKTSVNKGQVAVVEPKLQDPVMESKAMQTASDFYCSCGTCGDLSLDTCTCPTAVKEREFIRSMVKEGRRSEQIAAAVNKTYGHMKIRNGLTVPSFPNLDNSLKSPSEN